MISLDDRKWRQFKIKDLFTIRGGKDYPKKDQSKGDLPFVGASSMNNGVVNFLENKANTPNAIFKNAISVNRTGSVGYCFYHKYTAYYQGRVRALFRKGLNEPIALFFCTCIRQQHHQFSYGFGLGTEHLKKMRINLPVTSAGRPDWQFMTDYMKQVRSEISSSYVHNHVSHPKYSLDSKRWKQFRIKNIGTIISSRDYPKKNRCDGNLPYVGRTQFNNGITDYIADTKDTPSTIYKNVIAVNRNGSTGYAFYHPYSAYFSGGIRVIRMSHLNLFVGMFICTCIRQQRHQFNYGFELGRKRLLNLRINLPVDDSGHSDWKFMTDYMMSMLR